MTGKRCTDCKYSKGIGFDFWCGEGHTEYEVFGAETNCPYFEYHDWSKGGPSRMTEKRFYVAESNLIDGYCVFDRKKKYAFTPRPRKADCLNDAYTLNELYEENEQLKQLTNDFAENPTQHNLWKLRTVVSKDSDIE